MRGIRFRGKRLADGEWTFGWLAIEPDGTAWISRYHRRGEWEQVEPETVGQFTGYLDSKGNELFEGDITSRVDDSPICYPGGEKKYASWITDFQYAGWHFQSNPASPSISYPSFYSNAKYMEIIGNIHDNPELLGDTQ